MHNLGYLILVEVYIGTHFEEIKFDNQCNNLHEIIGQFLNLRNYGGCI